MKKRLLLATALLLSIGVIPSHAQVITSIQFANAGVLTQNSSTVAGVIPVGYWNNTTLTGSPGSNAGIAVTNTQTGLLNSTGTASSVTTSIVSYGDRSTSGQTFGGSDPNASNDTTLLANGAITRGLGSSSAAAPNPVTLTLSGLQPSDTYSFYLYVSGQSSLMTTYSLSLSSGGTYYASSPNGGFNATTLTAFTNSSTSTDFESSVPGGVSASTAALYQSNYVLFSGVTGVSSETITLTELGEYPGVATYSPAGSGLYGSTGWALGFSGIQVVDTASVPEPSTVALLALGSFAALAVFRRRRMG